MGKNVYVLIPAAGSSSRMGSTTNKQFMAIRQIPVIIRTVKLFVSLPEVSSICLISSAADMPAMQEICRQYNLSEKMMFAEGGHSRQHSVLNGLRHLVQQVELQEDDIVLVHDGARCLITAEVVRRCIEGIQKYGVACAAAVPVKDTIKQIRKTSADSVEVEKTLDRSLLWSMQTPQGAAGSSLINAYEAVTARNQMVTDDLAVMEAENHKTRLTLGDYRNIKVTTPEDILLAEALLTENK